MEEEGRVIVILNSPFLYIGLGRGVWVMINHSGILEGLLEKRLDKIDESRRGSSVGWGFATLVLRTSSSDNRDKIIQEFVGKVLGRKWRILEEYVGDTNSLARDTLNKSLFVKGNDFVNTWLLVESVEKDMTFRKVTNWVEKLRSVVSSKGINCRVDYTTYGNSDDSHDPIVQKEENRKEEEQKKRNLGLMTKNRFVVVKELKLGNQVVEVGTVWQSASNVIEGEDSMFVKMNQDGLGWFSPRTVIDISPDLFRNFRDKGSLVVLGNHETPKKYL